MNCKERYKSVLWISGFFLFIYFMPLGKAKKRVAYLVASVSGSILAASTEAPI